MTYDVIEKRGSGPHGWGVPRNRATSTDLEDPMTETLTGTLAETVDTWLHAYGETDPAARAALIERVWAPDGVLVDPPFTGTGHAEISTLAGAAQGQFPGHTFRRSSEVDAHHDLARYTWELLGPDGTPALAGTDVVLLGQDGRLQYVAGFFGEPAPRAAGRNSQD
jgi:hypothetical protein